MELLAFLDFHQTHIVAIQETKNDNSIATSGKTETFMAAV